MAAIAALWLPILLSALVVFIVSAAFWMAMPHHKNDFSPASDQDALMDAVRSSTPGPGMYFFPWAAGGENSPEYKEMARRGPVGILRVRDPASVLNMGPAMLKAILLNLVIGVFIAYLATVTLAADASYLSVFQVTGTAAFMAYGFVGYQEAIWFGLPAKVAFKHSLDGLVYALLTAGIFGWLWPA